jgi:hypothetical protein
MRGSDTLKFSALTTVVLPLTVRLPAMAKLPVIVPPVNESFDAMLLITSIPPIDSTFVEGLNVSPTDVCAV